MRRRCQDPKYPDYKNYGARGITVCPEWARSFEAFWTDMGPMYKDKLTLDRIDNDGPYSPENCRWADWATQGNNKRTNVRITTPDGEMTVSEAARHYGIKTVTLHARLFRYKWPMEKALVPPKSTTS
jgi:hypothetical protein